MLKSVFERSHVVWRVCAEPAMGSVPCFHCWTPWDIFEEENSALLCADVEDCAGAFIVVVSRQRDNI